MSDDVDVRAELEPESYARLLRMAKVAGPVVRRNAVARIRKAADVAAEAAKSAVLSAAAGGASWRPMAVYTRGGRMVRGTTKAKTYLRHSGLRSGIAAGVSVSVRADSVRITSSNKNLRADQYRMNRTYNHASFRHPVFGRGSVVQSGVEWFYKPIERVAPEFEAGVVRAIEESNEEIAGS